MSRLLPCCAAFFLSVASMVPVAGAFDRADIVLADFEGHDYGAWKTEGTAFGSGPANAALANQMPVSGFLGQGFATSYHDGDDSTGKLISPSFTINRKYISFLIGGGGFAGTTCLNLIVNGNVVRSATGTNTLPGGDEALAPASWDVTEFVGRAAHIEAVDQATGGWGHINVDQVVLSDHAPAKMLSNVSRELRLEHPLLNIPLQTGAPVRHLTISVQGKVIRELDCELAPIEPAYWSSTDVTPWMGQTATLRISNLPEDSRGLANMITSDRLVGSDNLYAEPLRPQFHFSSKRGWLNDPNGLAYYKGEYHLFYQHSPFTWSSTRKYWGHAVSKDLLHWEELPTALEPDALGDIYSGGAVLDSTNMSGLGSAGQPPLLLFYTATTVTGQCLASTTDGRKITKYPGNPVLAKIAGGNRDPRVIWHEPSKKWVMALYVDYPNPDGTPDANGYVPPRNTITFLGSQDLKQWTPLSEIEGYAECPDIFELPLDGDKTKKKWVLTAGNSNYQIGTFDGTTFTPETPKLPGQRGNGMYAAQTFANMPDARRVQIGWALTPAPGMPFNQSMCFPCELTLRTTPEGPRMFWNPVSELERLPARMDPFSPQNLAPGQNPLATVKGNQLEIETEIEPGQATQIEFNVRDTRITYDVAKHELSCLGHSAELPLQKGRVRLRLLVDRLSIEVFGDDGLLYMPLVDHPKSQDLHLSLVARGGTAKIDALNVRELASIWPAASKMGAK